MRCSILVCLVVAAACCLALTMPVEGRKHHRGSLFERIGRDFASGGKPKQAANVPLPKINIGKVVVTGVSSGGYMASQLLVAYSSIISGAGIFAAGPYGCAGGSLLTALGACTDDTTPLNTDLLVASAITASSTGLIDPLTNLADAPVWLFHGSADSTVKKPVSDAAYRVWQALGTDVIYNNDTQANHAWVSPLGSNPCTVSVSPYTAQCGKMDPQDDMLSHVLGRAMKAPNTGMLTGALQPFSQDEFALGRWAMPAGLLSMDSTGFLYVPASCGVNSTSTTVCDIVVVLHGCEQSFSIVGMDLVQQANINQYADTNNLVVLYPQAIAMQMGVVLNPKACWDWWGYLGADELYTVKGSYQMEVLMNMIKAIKA